MSSLESRAFGENFGSFVGRITQQLRDIERKIEEYKKSIIEMDGELHALTTSLATLTVTVNNLSNQVQSLSNRVEGIDARNAGAIASSVELANQAQKIQSLEDDRKKLTWTIFGAIILATVGMILSFSRVEYQSQHPR